MFHKLTDQKDRPPRRLPDDPQIILDQLQAVAASDQEAWLVQHLPKLTVPVQEKIAQLLKQQADIQRRVNLRESLRLAQLIEHMAQITDNDLFKALSLRAQGNVHALGYADHEKGLACYEQAAAIYRAHGRLLEEAQTQIGKIWSLASLGQSEKAQATGEWAFQILENQKDWPSLATLTCNMGIINGRLGQDQEALKQFDKAHSLYETLDVVSQDALPMVKINKAIILRNLGRFEESIQFLQQAIELYREQAQWVGVARAEQNLAMTYFVIGRYNEALALWDEARTVYLEDGRHRDAMMVELSVSDCLLQLRRYKDVLEKCREGRQLFTELGTRLEIGHALLNAAIAHVGLEEYEESLELLAEARTCFEAESNLVAVADANLQEAAVWLYQGHTSQALEQARQCTAVFQEHQLPIGQARAILIAARAAKAQQAITYAIGLANQVLHIGEHHTLPALTYQAYHLRGSLAAMTGNKEEALATFDQAIEALERLCGRLMIEFRADFVADKGQIYEETVALCLDLGQPDKGLEYCERAKSRALQDLVAHRLDLRIEARSPADQPLVDKLLSLRYERDRLYRRWATGEELGQRGGAVQALSAQHRVEKKVLDLEKQITDLWHKLLVRNAEYAREAALWQIHMESAQPYLPPEAGLLEYFTLQDQIVVFLVTATSVNAYRLPVTMGQIQKLLQLFRLNLKAIPNSKAARIPLLTQNSQGILRKLYDHLLAPIAGEIARFEELMIVPHGSLHYLPFHALHDGQNYLVKTYLVSYLPGSSLLRHCQSVSPTKQTAMYAIGHSCQGRLPHTITEAQTVARHWGGKLILEDAASLENVRTMAEGSKVLHLATHGEFRPDNPLFSGLELADGWLTTLDIFNLRLSASLVTLSACQTGRSVIGGGDELLGLMRAFLGAGAASLVSTFWAVEDRSTAELMDLFYGYLANGRSKGAALRQAQLRFLENGRFDAAYQHPYFWAPFFLVGDPGPL